MHTSRREFLRLFGGALAGTALASLATQRRAETQAVKYAWIMHEETFMRSVGHPECADLRRAMYGSTCFVTREDWTQEPPAFGTRRVDNSYARDYRKMDERFHAGRFGPGDSFVWAIENGGGGPWPVEPEEQTPVYMQKDLEKYLRLARRKAEGYGAILIAAPAVDILYNLVGEDWDGKNRLEHFLRLKIPATCARLAHLYGVQAQQMQQNLDAYRRYVLGCTRQAREASPTTRVLAGLTTNSRRSDPEDYPTAQEIASAAKSVMHAVDGYWMNVPPHRETGERDYRRARMALRLFYGLPATIG